MPEAGRAGTGDTLGLTATRPQTERGQRNEDGHEPFHEKILRVSVTLRSEGDCYKQCFHMIVN